MSSRGILFFGGGFEVEPPIQLSTEKSKSSSRWRKLVTFGQEQLGTLCAKHT